jgi:hypothetical protein
MVSALRVRKTFLGQYLGRNVTDSQRHLAYTIPHNILNISGTIIFRRGLK